MGSCASVNEVYIESDDIPGYKPVNTPKKLPKPMVVTQDNISGYKDINWKQNNVKRML
jgi:hypothetical protein